MVKTIQQENNFTAHSEIAKKFAATVGKDFTTFNWKAPENKSQEVIFTIGDVKHTLGAVSYTHLTLPTTPYV